MVANTSGSPGPTPEQLRRGAKRVEWQIADSAGAASWPFQAPGLLGRLEANGTIDRDMRQAGERFGELFYSASLDELRCAPLDRVPGGNARHDLPPRVETARRQVAQILASLGGPSSRCGSAAWHILGCGLTVAEWARRERWGGKPINQHLAAGVLVATLSLLAAQRRRGFVA